MKFKYKLISFITSFVILLSVFSLTAFADNSNYDTIDSPTNTRLCGLPFFNANTNYGTFAPYFIDNLSGSSNRICQIFAVKYFNGRVYIPLQADSPVATNLPAQFVIYKKNSFINNNSTYYFHQAFNPSANHNITGKNALINPDEYSSAESLCSFNDESDNLFMGIKSTLRKDDNGFVYESGNYCVQVDRFAYINDSGVIDYVSGHVLGDDIFNASSQSLGWVAIFRNFTGTNYNSALYDLLSVLNLFGDNTGFSNGNDLSTPQAIFPRYPSTAWDNSGFYYDDLSSVPLSFYVKDYGNKHKYSLQIKTTQIKSDKSSHRTDFGVQLDLPSYTWINKEYLDSILTNVQNLTYSKNFLSRWSSNKLILDNIMTVNFPCLDFSRVDNGARSTSCTFNLSSFVKGEDTQFFVFYVIDETSGECVGSCAVLTSKGFGYTPSSYPVKTYSWNNDNFDANISTGGAFGGHNDYSGATNGLCYTPTISSDGDALTGNSKYYDGSDFDYTDYNKNNIDFNVDISSLTNTFGTALDSTRQFFALCIGLIPPAIIAFIFGTLALIVLLRILGR